MRLPPPHDIITQTSSLHVGVAESAQFDDAEYVVATMVLPVKGIVKEATATTSSALAAPGSSVTEKSSATLALTEEAV